MRGWTIYAAKTKALISSWSTTLFSQIQKNRFSHDAVRVKYDVTPRHINMPICNIILRIWDNFQIKL